MIAKADEKVLIPKERTLLTTRKRRIAGVLELQRRTCIDGFTLIDPANDRLHWTHAPACEGEGSSSVDNES